MKIVRVDPLYLDLGLAVDDWIERYYDVYGKRPKVVLRLARKYAKGFYHNADASISVWALSEDDLEWVLCHEFAHFKAGPSHGHCEHFYADLWDIASKLGANLDKIEEIERGYKPRNSKTFMELRRQSGQ